MITDNSTEGLDASSALDLFESDRFDNLFDEYDVAEVDVSWDYTDKPRELISAMHKHIGWKHLFTSLILVSYFLTKSQVTILSADASDIISDIIWDMMSISQHGLA